MPTERILQQATAHHQAGRLAEAEGMYRQILQGDPENADALHRLGIVAIQTQNFAVAIELISRAAELRPDNPLIYGSLGQALAGANRPAEAITAFRKALEFRPDLLDAHFGLSLALQSTGRRDESLIAYHRLLELHPDFVAGHNNLGNVLFALGRVEEAVTAYRRAADLQPDYIDAIGNLGSALMSLKRTEEAIATFRRGLAIEPNSPLICNNLGNALSGLKRYDEAIDLLKRALELKPDFAQAAYNLGNALNGRGKYAEAVESFRRAVALDPTMVDAHNNMGNALQLLGDYKAAADAYVAAMNCKPDFIVAYNNLGSALRRVGKLDESIVALEQAIRMQPDFYQAHCNLGNSFKDAGRMDDAIASFRRAIEINPADHASHSNLVFSVQYHSDYDSAKILHETLKWNIRHAQRLTHEARPHENDRSPNRRLRIGYVGADFREHCQSLFTIPLLQNHDRQNFEIFCYAHISRPDEKTARIRGLCDGWQSIVGMTDHEVAEKIREDKIDILVDLTMHMSLGRPLVFARKPAPIQIAWLAYPGTTGLSAIDYRFTDPFLDPPGLHDHDYSEKSIRLPDTFWCYDPLSDEVEIAELPARKNGHITFGCLNNFCKASPQTLELWARVIQAVPNSKLILLAGPGGHRQTLRESFSSKGISADRLEFVEFLPRPDYLKVYNRIDIGLDTLPYNGHTTGLDSIWMGVPVVGRIGRTVVGRAGFSQLSNLGLKELAASSDDDFIKTAVDLAHDLDRLANLRKTLRERMKQSPLMNAPKFARGVESAYRQIWSQYCDSPANSSILPVSAS
ncbi:MAG TPA: tetratricopeptide repeat protein [Tepidisphaeraceae bacterium]